MNGLFRHRSLVTFESIKVSAILFDEFSNHGTIDVEVYIFVGIILHDLEDKDLIILEGLSVAVDEESEKVKEFRLIEASFWLRIDRVADLFDELANVDLVKKESLVIVVHFLQKIDAAHIFSQMVLNRGEITDESRFDVLVVPY